jgi:regulator of replication initiation timing
MKVSAAYRVKWLNKEIERLQDLLDRIVEDNAALRARNKQLTREVETLQAEEDSRDDPLTGDDSWLFGMDDSW